VIFLSRTNETNNLENLLIQIDSLSKAPICFATHRPQAWIDLNNGTNQPLCFLKKKCVVAFCGIGNPDSFAHTLKSLDMQIIRFFTYRDHHRYTIHELERMTELAQSRGAVALVTTEKDRVRIPSEFTNNIPVYILDIEMALQGGRETLETMVRPVMVTRKGTKE
jgi:tetraacyldisaccharide 4'-kinase